ncbi:MAG: cyclic nucleotide-binding domain-containing protein [Blastocatellia bacterium]
MTIEEPQTAGMASHPFLRGLDADALHLLAKCASNIRFPAGSVIFRQGGEATHFYLLQHGRVALDLYESRHGSHTIETLEAGEVLGWSWLIEPYRWQFDARAVELVRAISLDAACLREVCDTHPVLGYTIVKRLTLVVAERLTATRLQLMDLYGTRT